MKKIKILLSVIILTGFLSSALANASGAYLGEQVGYSTVSLDDVSTVKNK